MKDATVREICLSLNFKKTCNFFHLNPFIFTVLYSFTGNIALLFVKCRIEVCDYLYICTVLSIVKENININMNKNNQ